jgi:hypothetical protein
LAKILTNNKMYINIDCEEAFIVPSGHQKITVQILDADLTQILKQIDLEKILEFVKTSNK